MKLLVLLLTLLSTNSYATTPFKIYIITWIGNTDSTKGFQDYLKFKDIPVEITLRAGDTKIDRIKEFKKEIRQVKPDLIYIEGTPSGLELYGPHDNVDPANHITDIPIISVLPPTPIASKMIKDWGPTGRNLCGVSHMLPIKAQVGAMKDYMDFKKIGTLFTQNESNSIAAIQDLEQIGTKEGFSVIKTPIPIDPQTKKPISDEIPKILKSLEKEGVDLIYIPADTTLSTNTKILEQGLDEINTASFVPIELLFVKTKALMGLVSKWYSVGEYAGYKAEQILVHKKSASEMNFDRLANHSFSIRKSTFRKLKNYPPMNLLKYADIVD